MLEFLLTLFVLDFLVFFHELGHFSIAKWCGVGVEVFSIGFGPMLLKKKIGETTYAISLIPLGGYVRFVEEPHLVVVGAAKNQTWFFNRKPIWQRLSIVLAGPVANLVLAGTLLSIIGMWIGTPARGVAIGGTEANSPAARAGLLAGDRIYGTRLETGEENPAVAYFPLVSRRDLIIAIHGTAGKPLRLFVERTSVTPDVPLLLEVVVVPGLSPKNTWLIGVLFQSSFNDWTGPTSYAWGIDETVRQTEDTFKGIWSIFSGRLSPREGSSGPVGIFSIGSSIFRNGNIAVCLYFAAMLSVGLGAFNLLPIPALDGGHVPLLLLEGVYGKPLPQGLQAGWNAIGVLIILGIILTATYFDLARLFK